MLNIYYKSTANMLWLVQENNEHIQWTCLTHAINILIKYYEYFKDTYVCQVHSRNMLRKCYEPENRTCLLQILQIKHPFHTQKWPNNYGLYTGQIIKLMSDSSYLLLFLLLFLLSFHPENQIYELAKDHSGL